MKKFLALGLAALLLWAVPAYGAEQRMEITLRLASEGVDVTEGGLRPDEEYRFPILVQYEDEVPSHLREEEMEGKRLSVTVRQGSGAIDTPKIETEGGRYYLSLRTKPLYNTSTQEIELLVRLQNRASGAEISRDTARLEVGSLRMPSGVAESLGEGETLAVDNRSPIITAAQFRQLAATNSYRPVTLAGERWEYTVNVTDLGARNLYSTAAIQQELVEKYPDQEFRFLSFPAEPDFGAPGVFSMDVSDAAQEFGGEFYLYRLLGNRLYYLKSQYDEETELLTFRPSQLGSYVLTHRELGSLELTGTAAPSAPSQGSAEDIPQNPDTVRGAKGPGLAAALALLAGLSAAAVFLRRRA